MKGFFRYLAPFAPDYSGAVSALYAAGGLVVLCDPGGCSGNVAGYDEPRFYGDKVCFYSAAIREMDTIFGRDDKLKKKICAAAALGNYKFVALVGTPAVSVIGTDRAASAKAVEQETGIPAFSVNTSGMENYSFGEAKAIMSFVKKFLPANSDAVPSSEANKKAVFGATPLNRAFDDDLASLSSGNGSTMLSEKTAVEELKHIDGELQSLQTDDSYLEQYNVKWNTFESNVMMALDQLKQEIDNPQRFGFGPEAEAKLSEIENLFGLKTGTITRRGTRNTTKQERNDVCKYYDNVVKEQLEIKRQQHKALIDEKTAEFGQKTASVGPIRQAIKTTLEQLDDPQYKKEGVLKNARIVIGRAYAELKSQFNGLYEYNENIYRSDRLVKVTKVWGDYFKGRFKHTDYTLWYWILLAVIVDVAAFAFFTIAFKIG